MLTSGTAPLLLSLLFGSAAIAAGDKPLIELFLPLAPDRATSIALLQARGVVEKSYAAIGIRVVWSVGKAAPSSCEKTASGRRIVVHFHEGASVQRSSTALAFANPHKQDGPCVTVLLNQVRMDIERNPRAAAIRLGYVIAHETAHILQGVARHSDSGIMKAFWSERDTSNMTGPGLEFTAYDADLIFDALRPGTP